MSEKLEAGKLWIVQNFAKTLDLDEQDFIWTSGEPITNLTWESEGRQTGHLLKIEGLKDPLAFSDKQIENCAETETDWRKLMKGWFNYRAAVTNTELGAKIQYPQPCPRSDELIKHDLISERMLKECDRARGYNTSDMMALLLAIGPIFAGILSAHRPAESGSLELLAFDYGVNYLAAIAAVFVGYIAGRDRALSAITGAINCDRRLSDEH